MEKKKIRKKNIVYKFLWNGLSNSYLEGGLQLTKIDTYIKALQIKWILRLLENSNENWKIKYHKNTLRI